MKNYFVDEDHLLDELIPRLAESDTIAYDTEFVSESNYRPDLCLIQVATRDMVAIIDPKAVGDLSPFWDQLSRPDVTVIVHAAREEFRFCKRESGKRLGNLFDVQVAAGMVGIEFPAAYSNLIQKVLKKSVGKGETRTDWRRRPLSDKQIEYAQKDVLYLHDIYDWAVEKLNKKDRMAWFLDEMQLQQQKFESQDSDSAWMRLSGLNSLRGSELAIAKELWFWREREAERRDSPARRVLRDDLITEMAKRKSDDPNRIRAIRGMDRRDLERHVDSLAAVISESKNLPKPEMPAAPDRSQIQKLNLIGQFMNAVLAGICKTHKLAPAIVGNASDVKDFIAFELKLTQPTKDPALTLGWRAEVIGNQLRDVLRGKIAVRIDDPLGDNPISFDF